MTDPLVRAEALDKSFPTPGGSLDILRGVSMTLAAGEAAAILGPSGCGKSTMLSIVGALEEPTGGTVRVAGEDPFAMPEKRRAHFRNRTVGFVFQDHHLLPQCTVLENVLLPIVAERATTGDDVSRAEGLLKSVGMSDRRTHRPSELSGGERQRTALCRALINEPKLLLADEPTGNLDPKTADAVGDLLLDLGKGRGVGLLCVTHSVELAGRFPRRLRFEDGGLHEEAA